MATTTQGAGMHHVVQLAVPLLVATVISWLLFGFLSFQLYHLLRLTRRSQCQDPQDAVAPHPLNLGFASATPPVDQSGNSRPTDRRVSLTSSDPYSYPMSPTTPTSTQLSSGYSADVSHPPNRFRDRPMTMSTHPRIPSEFRIINALTYILYALICIQIVVGSIYTFSHLSPSQWDSMPHPWMQIVATDVIGSLVFALSLPVFAYRIFLLSPLPLPPARPRSILKTKSQHVQALPHPRYKYRYVCSIDVRSYVLPVLVFIAGLVISLCGLISGGNHLLHRPALGRLPPFDAVTGVWLVGSALLNALVFVTLLYFNVRSLPSIAMHAVVRIILFIGETGFAQFAVAVIALALVAANKHTDKLVSAPAAPALLLPALYANSVFMTLLHFHPQIPTSGALVKARRSGSYEKDIRHATKSQAGRRSGFGSLKSYGLTKKSTAHASSTIDHNIWNDGKAREERWSKAPTLVLPESQPMHMERDVLGEGSNSVDICRSDGYEVHALPEIGNRKRSMGAHIDNKGKKGRYWHGGDGPVMSIGRVQEDEEEEDSPYGNKKEDTQSARNSNITSASDVSSSKRELRDDSSWVHIPEPVHLLPETGFNHHNLQSQPVDSHVYRTSSYINNRYSDGMWRPAARHSRMSMGESTRARGMSSSGGSSGGEDSSVMIISPVHNEPSIVEPSMFKAASVAATRASTGSAWSSYTYPKPMAFPDLDEDLQYVNHDTELEPKPKLESDSEPNPSAKAVADVHPYAREARDEAQEHAEKERKRGEESRKRRWHVHPLTRMGEMGRLRW